MQCVNCGHENPSDAKFCGRCGTSLTAPARTAAPTPAPAASAIGAVPSPSGSERQTAKFIVLGAVVILLGVGGYLGYQMFGGGLPEMPPISAPTMETAKPAPMPEPPKDAAPAAVPAPEAAPATAPAATEPMKEEAAPAAEPTKAEEPVKAEPPVPAPPKATPAPKPAPKAPPPPPKAAPPTAPPHVAPQPQAAPAEQARPDRWALMAQEMEACKREPFLNRVVCEQKVGQKYCKGYWGLVPECGGKAQ
jgi:hypothetical protein